MNQSIYFFSILITSLTFLGCNLLTNSPNPSAMSALALAFGGAQSVTDNVGQPENLNDPLVPPVDGTPTPSAPSNDVCVTETGAFYVSGDSGQDSNDGSKAFPVKTIRKAMDLVSSGNAICVSTRSSNASYEEETATLNVKSGVSIFGGYTSSWVRDEVQNPTKWKTNRIGLMYSNLNGDAELSGFNITAKNSEASNESSYVILITNGTAKLLLKNLTLNAGSVFNGKSTTPGSSIGVLAFNLSKLRIESSEIRSGDASHGNDGTNGNSGVAGGKGGNGLSGNCDVSHPNASGGSGGEHPTLSSLNGFAGGRGGQASENGITGLGSCGGVGGGTGDPGAAGLSPTCAVQHGATGSQGSFSGTNIGTFFPYYQPANGSDGIDGSNGVPGSGGGGGGGQHCSFMCNKGTGNGAGGGGAAGSGGLKGTASQGGGGSFAVVLLELDEVLIDHTKLISGSAGNGGKAGNGGDGGLGGDKGLGIILCTGEVGRGGDGSPGGKGGNGGDGSAGGGGSSIALVLKSVTSLSANDNTFKTGLAGAGGSARHSYAGNGGHSIGVYSVTGSSYTLSNSQFELGTEGSAGSVTGTGTLGISGRKTNHSWD
ncbi:hypothetical protein EHQ30_03555 [Leptospira brenneri]|uniref:DUF1565 domain-containing protein n=1 Tax=Leptospira brenneri TaxID=2023182 RepID=A0A5F1Z9N9_9LEPT|nr:hypothetical protein [Leptospira brenneri]TGK95724.1 hypothetical protein EHQ30_03555 [Leptospira brenneri]